jgi:hypothetical protein
MLIFIKNKVSKKESFVFRMSTTKLPFRLSKIGHLLRDELKKHSGTLKRKERFLDFFRGLSVEKQREFEEEICREKRREEMQEVCKKMQDAEKIGRELFRLKKDISLLCLTSDDTAELESLNRMHEELSAQKFVTDFSACMSITTRQSCMMQNRNAYLLSKYMQKSPRRFHITDEGEISSIKKKSEVSDLDQIIEVSEDDSEDDSVDSFVSVDSVDSVDSEEE